MNKTKITGVYYRELKTNDKDDKTFYITYKDTITNKRVLVIVRNIGKASDFDSQYKTMKYIYFCNCFYRLFTYWYCFFPADYTYEKNQGYCR